MRTAAGGIILASLLANAAGGEAPPGVRRETLDALNGALVTEDPRSKIEALARLHSLRATAAFDEAADLVAGWARDGGLAITVVDFPADGSLRYGPFLSEPGWKVTGASLRMIEPVGMTLADGSKEPLALAWFSGSAEVTAELVDAGRGVLGSHYHGKDVSGRIVLADGPHGEAHEQAVYLRGAAGVVSGWHLFGDKYPDLRSSDGAGIRPWAGPDGGPPGFVFSVPSKTAAELRRLLQSGTRVLLDARVRTEIHPSHYRVVSAVLRGSRHPEEEVLFVNHLDATAPGVVHNAAAALSLLEAGSALARLVGSGVLPAPDRTLRFLWVPEHRGTMAYLLAHPELKERIVAAMNVDMPTAHHGRTGAVTYLYRTPDSRPSFADDVFGELLEWVRDGNTVQLGTDLFPYPVISEAGSRESFHAGVADFEGLSDHVEFLASGIPMGFFGAWPFDFLGTTGDTMELFDATQLKRVALVLAAGGYSLASASGVDLAPTFLERAQKRLLEETSRRIATLPPLSEGAGGEDPYPAYKEGMDALRFKLDREMRALATLGRLGLSEPERFADELRASGERAREALTRRYRALCERQGRGAREAAPTEEELSYQRSVPERTGAFEGPITRDFLRERLSRDLTDEELALFRRHPYAAFEAWNFTDGVRSVTDVRKAVSAELGAVTMAEIVAFYAALEEAGWIRMRRAF